MLSEKPIKDTMRRWARFGGKKSKAKKNKRTCKRRRVRKNSDGSLNEEDMEYNRKCEQKYMMIDNPWMKDVLNKKNQKVIINI